MKCCWFSIRLFISRAFFVFLFPLFKRSLVVFIQLWWSMCSASLYFAGLAFCCCSYQFPLNSGRFSDSQSYVSVCVCDCRERTCCLENNTRTQKTSKQNVSHAKTLHSSKCNETPIESWFIVLFDIQGSCMNFNHTTRLDFPRANTHICLFQNIRYFDTDSNSLF